MKQVATWAVAAVVAGAVLAAAPQTSQTHHAPAVTLPAGTTINVRLTQAIDVDVAQAGMTFKARVDDPVMVDGRIVIPPRGRCDRAVGAGGAIEPVQGQ